MFATAPLSVLCVIGVSLGCLGLIWRVAKPTEPSRPAIQYSVQHLADQAEAEATVRLMLLTIEAQRDHARGWTTKSQT